MQNKKKIISGLECIGFEDDGPSGPSGVYRTYYEISLDQHLKVLSGEFKGIEYRTGTKKRIYEK